MTWDAYNRRRTAVREIATLADQRRDLTLTELLDHVDPRRAAFDDEHALLLDLQLAWFQRLSGECDRIQSDHPELVAVSAWADSAAALPGIRAVLDRHLDEPVLAKALDKEHALLALASGVPYDATAMRHRATHLIESARERVAVTEQAVELARASCRPSLLARLRSAVA